MADSLTSPVRSPKVSTRVKEALWAYTFISPNFLGFLIFTSLPVLASLTLSFMEWDLLSLPRWVGLDNYASLLGFRWEAGHLILHDPLFWKFTYNTLFLMLAIPLNIAGSLLVALAMNQRLRGIVLYRTLFFLPSICSYVAVAILWIWIYNPSFGPVNTLIAKVGQWLNVPLEGPHWLGDPNWAKPALILMGLWVGLGGYNMILYLAALQGIPKELYDAAQIDGASAWQRFWHVTWPMVSPTTFFITIMSIIAGFQGGFTAAYIMTGGGPAGSTTTIEYYIFNNAYQWFRMGFAASIAWVLFLVIFVVTLINWRFGGRLVHYT